MRKLVFVLLSVCLLTVLFSVSSCGYFADESQAVQAAQNHGFTNVNIVDECRLAPTMMCGCDDRDSAGFDMTATNPIGKQVNITVCCGWAFKGCTIRSN